MPKIPSPMQMGLPEKFDRWRPGQEEALTLLENSTNRFDPMCAPTGFGKSAVAVADALRHDEATCIVTESKGLQSQYMRDFEQSGMVDLRGRNNYRCKMREDYTCDDGHHARCQYKGTVACDASRAEIRAGTSRLVVTNYAKWTSCKKFGTGLSHIKRLILDEAHNCPNAIASAMQVLLHYKEIEDGLGINFPKGSDAEQMTEWKRWSSACKGVAEIAMQQALARITGVSDPKPAHVRQFSHMRNLVRRLAILSTCAPQSWIVEEFSIHGKRAGYQFDPIRPGRYAESTLFLRVPKVIMISATLRPKTMYMCGVPGKEFTFKEFPSDFDPKRSPLYYIPTMRVDSKAADLGLLWAFVDRIITRRRDRKGIIHTVSFARQNEIKQKSRFWESMIINPQGSPTTDIVEDFKYSGPGSILVSPSVGEGYDFPNGDCRYQILCKIPFEPPSRIVKAREADDPEYRSYQSMQSLVQAVGRGMRSADDYCENFIGDMHLDWFWNRNKHLAPNYFHKLFQYRQHLPAPAEF